MKNIIIYFNLFIFVLAYIICSDSQNNISKAKQMSLGGEENGCLALNYHRIREDRWIDKLLSAFSNSKEFKVYSVTSDQFENHIKWLKKHNANFVTLKEFIDYKNKGKFPKKCVWLNFDDMDKSIYENAFPIMKKYRINGTGFVITGNVGKKDFHNLEISSKEELLEMKYSGLFEYATHTHNLHSMKKSNSILVKSAENKGISKDINTSTKYIKKELNGNIQSIAYPYGQTSDKVVKELSKKTSIKYGFILEEQAVVPENNNYYIPRILISDESFNKIVKRWAGFKNE